MPATYDAIATTTVSGGFNSVNFSSISQSYTDLRAVIIGSWTQAGQMIMRINNNTSFIYSFRRLSGDGNAASTGAQQGRDFWNIPAYSFTNLNQTYMSFDFMNYSSTAANKIALVDFAGDRNGSGAISSEVLLAQTTAAISSIQFTIEDNTTTWVAGSTFTLYGILRA
jgi:hypothetical protein